MPEIYFSPALSPAKAFPVWHKRLESASSSLPEAIENPTESYVRAMKVCASGRMLTIEFHDAWRAAGGMEEREVIQVRDLMKKSLFELEAVERRGLVIDEDEERRGSHLAEMISNTRSRVEILNVMLDEDLSFYSRCVEIDSLYKTLGEAARMSGRGR